MKRIVLCFLAVVFMLTGCDKSASDKEKGEEDITEASLVNIEQEDAKNPASRTCLFFEKPDNIMISEEEVQQIETIDGVDYVEMYGIINKINYYYQEGMDYTDEDDKFTPLNSTHYMKSSRMLAEEDLQEGVLPQNSNEIVLYSSDADMLGQTLTIYFYGLHILDKTENLEDFASSYWEHTADELSFCYGQYCVKREFKITGILKEKETQIYFSEDFCKMIGTVFANFPYVDSRFKVFLSDLGTGIDSINGVFGADGNIRIESLDDPIYTEYEWPQNSDITISPHYMEHKCIIVLNDTLKPDEMRVSQRFLNQNYVNETGSEGAVDDYFKIYNIMSIQYQVPSISGSTPIYWETDSLCVLGKSYVGFSRENHYHLYSTLFLLSDITHNSGAYIVEAGKEIFDRFYPYEGSRVMSVYVKDEMEAENITNMLESMGYQLYHKRSYAEMKNELYDYWSRVYRNSDGILVKEGTELP